VSTVSDRRRVAGRYRHVISLGYFCGPAAELERYGLRDGSYPFDWNITPLRSAVAMVESRFRGFLELDRLERDQERPGIIYDQGSGIAVYNSFRADIPLDRQYGSVRDMYARRIGRFCQAVTEPTLFVRYMLDRLEFDYLNQNMPATLAVLRQGNPKNDLLLVANADLPPLCGGIRVYNVFPDAGDVVARRFVAKNSELERDLLRLSYPLVRRVMNLGNYWWRSLRKRMRLRTRLSHLRSGW
jgi:hypothetical protein